MSAQLSGIQVLVLCSYAAGIVGGQILFKMAAIQLAPANSMLERGLMLLHNACFLVAMAIYLILSVVWVWILTFTPISRAYPFLALAIAVTPIVGGMMFEEPITLRLMLGLCAVVAGLFVITGA